MEIMTIRNVVLLAVILITGVHAQEKPEWQTKLPRTLQADFPYTKAAVRQNFPKDTVANKGMAIIAGREAFMCFDTDLLRWSAGWTGNYLTEDGVSFRGNHGASPRIAGDQKFGSGALAGWADAQGSFADPRKEPFGPLPGRRPNGAAVMWPMTRWCSVTPWAMCNFSSNRAVWSRTVKPPLCAACNTAR